MGHAAGRVPAGEAGCRRRRAGRAGPRSSSARRSRPTSSRGPCPRASHPGVLFPQGGPVAADVARRNGPHGAPRPDADDLHRERCDSRCHERPQPASSLAPATTPPQAAAKQGFSDICKILLDQGAEASAAPFLPTRSLFFPLQSALPHSTCVQPDVSAPLRAPQVDFQPPKGVGAGDTALAFACSRVRLYFAGAPFSGPPRSDKGSCPARSQGQTDTVRLLLERKADPSRLNHHGVSPLMLACRAGSKEVAEARARAALLAPGAISPTRRRRLRKSPRFRLRVEPPVCNEQLIIAKAGDKEVAKRDAKERSPLIYAMEGGSKAVAELLLSAPSPSSRAWQSVPSALSACAGRCCLFLRRGALRDRDRRPQARARRWPRARSSGGRP